MTEQNQCGTGMPHDRPEPLNNGALVEAGVRVFEEWESALDFNGGSAALRPDIERLIRDLYELQTLRDFMNDSKKCADIRR